jgi:predicted kinase
MPVLHVICGPAGVGKSTYGRKLAAGKQACFLDSDTVTEPVVRAGLSFGGGDPDDRDSATYRRAFRDPVYECLLATAAENLPHVDVVIVGPFTSEIRDPEWAGQLVERLSVEVKVIFLICDEEERRLRIEQRGNPRDDLKLRDWAQYLANTDMRPPAFPHEMVRT